MVVNGTEGKEGWVRCPCTALELNSRERKTVDETYKGITIAIAKARVLFFFHFIY